MPPGSLDHNAFHAAGYRHAAESIGSVTDAYSGRLTPDLAVSTYRNIQRLFPSRTIAAGSAVRELPRSPRSLGEISVAQGDEHYDLYDYLALNSVTGLLVLHRGQIRYETYQRGNGPDTRWMSMSVAKSVTSTLAGMAIHDGAIAEGLARGWATTCRRWPIAPIPR